MTYSLFTNYPFEERNELFSAIKRMETADINEKIETLQEFIRDEEQLLMGKTSQLSKAANRLLQQWESLRTPQAADTTGPTKTRALFPAA